MSGGEVCPFEVFSVEIFERIPQWLAYRNELRLQESPTQLQLGCLGWKCVVDEELGESIQ
jgi:hypothetical protein